MTNTAMTAAEVCTAVNNCETVHAVPVADYNNKPCAECGRKFTALREKLLCSPHCEEESAARLEREAAAKEEAVAAFTAVLTIADKFRMNAADGLRRCLNPFCDKTVTGRKNRKCCDANCRLLFFRYSAKHQLEIAEDKEAKRARKASPAAAKLRPAQTLPVHSAAVRYSFVTNAKNGSTASREIDIVTGQEKIAAKKPPNYGCKSSLADKDICSGGGKILASYGAEYPSGVLPPKFRAPKESVQTIPLYTFYTHPARIQKEEEKRNRRLARNAALARELNEKFLAAEAAPYVPMCTAEVNKPHGTPRTIRTDKCDGELQSAKTSTGSASLVPSHLPPSPVTEFMPTTGRETPSYLANENENVTTVIPAVKKKRVKKAV